MTESSQGQIINCHVHTFTHRHTPDRFLPWPVNSLARLAFVREFLYWLARVVDPKREGALGRYVEIIRTSYDLDQRPCSASFVASTRPVRASLFCRWT
jgi:hypothetical protein